MARRSVPVDPSIGERIQTRRQLRRWSIRHAASRAGIAHTTWARIERGELRTDRYMIADLAAALECPVSDLTGQPHVPADRQLETAHARVEALWRALVEIAPDEPPTRQVRPAAELTERMDLLASRRRICDYVGVGQLLPDLLADLHAAAAGPEAREALVMLINATYAATFTLRHLGYMAESALAAERCRQTAERLGDPVPLAVADWVRAHAAVAAGSFRRSLTLTTRAADELERHLGEPTAAEVLGMLHLTAAVSVLGDGHDRERRVDDALAHLAEAEQLAQRTGETRSWAMSFGPTNCAIWRMGIEVDTGAPGRAVEVARDTNPAVLDSKARQASYYSDFARALADVNADRDAVRMLLAAERIAPQRVRSSVSARETGRFLLNRSRLAAGGSELRGLCERMGVAG
jgi:transcriptional regulator with XRE-family HTH domain